ncbi:ABC transporter ATP-binding protein [Glycomyces algeriensis]|uniref:Multidrug ABC transporter ATP-binding protein n=1 Tax=Glycomyces algeriensis TaxID=256037 RepID=A0A9W6GAY1_9ACTN|nr:ABC transporter ATP-binding protein [Glycomyces algeriensis]MDA1364755.1 ABC transporter ATP-binding protein [Glycomyces algeriensis]MDR7350796.1 ABC-2 type transport system ATP-binding protein [Glycomyces algeriensis]GLI43507.1 multidrug ABC transporter ATP-binding protein [Glycomyces algeriensis]
MNAITHQPAPPVEVRDLTCRYGAFTAVDRVSFTVGHGELFALLGTNGAGKTTTLETAIGLRRPASGTARVLGRDPGRHRRELAGAVAVIGQETGFADDLTVAETLKLWTDLHRLAPRAELLERVDLAHRAQVRVGALSGGERRRLDLALAAATDPEVLFADEPTTGLDPASRRRTWGLLRELTEQGTAVVLTTHYLDEAAELADHVAIMDRGRIVRFGTVAEITASYEARITARPEPFDPIALPALAGRTAIADGRLTVRTTELQRDLHRLLDWAARDGVALADLKAEPATLDEIFAELETEPADRTGALR